MASTLEKTRGDGLRTGEDSQRNLWQKAVAGSVVGGQATQRKKAVNFRRRHGKDTPATPSSFPYSSACPPCRRVSSADPIAFFLLCFGAGDWPLPQLGPLPPILAEAVPTWYAFCGVEGRLIAECEFVAPKDMASRGRRGVPAREGEQRRDEPRREDQGEQHAPALQGPVLPPPPPVDYGAHTQAALQAQLEAQAQVPVPQAQNHGGPSIMERFKRMSPPSFKGESDRLLAESWMREIEKIFRAIRCAEDDKVTLATYMLHVCVI
ncbi:hypothetical protein Taro_009109 [Colocasia esculenta]|uniref:Uncharacterized protein n=1 Tax=Colocasia esculenta TaxID=4460 RepID=A0A843U926_COLES|nr:hypothetical protein [Colocasia esculenta]